MLRKEACSAKKSALQESVLCRGEACFAKKRALQGACSQRSVLCRGACLQRSVPAEERALQGACSAEECATKERALQRRMLCKEAQYQRATSLPGIGATPARRVIRIIRSYGLALRVRHPAAPPAWHQSLQPAKPAPHRGRNSDFALPPRSEFRLRSSTKVGIPTLVFCPKNPSPGQRRRSISNAVLVALLTECFFHHYSLCRQRSEFRLRSSTEVEIPTSLFHRGRNSDFGILPEKPITGPAPKVRQRPASRQAADRMFFPPLLALPLRIASACTRGVIRVPLTVELQLEAQTFPFLPILGP